MKTSKINIVPFADSNDLAEIYQTSSMVFAFLSAPRDGSKQCHPFIKCRDFLQDAVRTMLTGNTSKIYGFVYDKGKNPPIDLRRMRLIVKNKMKPEQADEVMKKAIKLLNHYEEIARVSPSKVTKEKDVYVFTGSSFWLTSPVLISLYTFLIRLSEQPLNFTQFDNGSLLEAYKVLIESSNNNDTKYLKEVKDFIYKICKYSGNIFTLINRFDSLYYKELPINTFHNNSGIVSLCGAVSDTHIYHKAYVILQEYVNGDFVDIDELEIVNHTFLRGAVYSIQPLFGVLSTIAGVKKVYDNRFSTCRETLTHTFGEFISSKEYEKEEGKDKAGIIVTFSGLYDNVNRAILHKKSCFFAKRVLNFFENKYGIKNTKISSIRLFDKVNKTKQYGWVFYCDAEWSNSPIMLSLFALILRMAESYSRVSKKEHKVLNDEVIDLIISKCSNKTDSMFFVKEQKMIEKIIVNRNKLLYNNCTALDNYWVTKEKRDDLLKRFPIYGTSDRRGIASLFNSTNIDRDLVNRFKELKNAK